MAGAVAVAGIPSVGMALVRRTRPGRSTPVGASAETAQGRVHRATLDAYHPGWIAAPDAAGPSSWPQPDAQGPA